MSYIQQMTGPTNFNPRPSGCKGCRGGRDLPFDFTMAFQPVVDITNGRIWAYEALVRGMSGEQASFILDLVDDDLMYRFDQACRVKAIELAGDLFEPDSDTLLSINFMPNAVYEPRACIRATLEAANRADFRQDRIMFEFTENEKMQDVSHVRRILETYKERGFTTAIDDFGAGYAGLGLLAELKPDVIKIDMALIRDIDSSASRRAIVRAIVSMAGDLGITTLAEGIETEAEFDVVRSLGIKLCQGFFIAAPQTAMLPSVNLESLTR